MGQRASSAAAPVAAAPVAAASAAVASVAVAPHPAPAPAFVLAPPPAAASIEPCPCCGASVSPRCCRALSTRLPLAIIIALDADAAHSILAFLPLRDFLHAAQVCRRWYNHACSQPARSMMQIWPRRPPVSLAELRPICVSPLWRGVLPTLEVGSWSDPVMLFDPPALHVMRSLRSLALFLGDDVGQPHEQAQDRQVNSAPSRCEQASDRGHTGAETPLHTLSTLPARGEEKAYKAPAAHAWAQAFPASLTELYLDSQLKHRSAPAVVFAGAHATRALLPRVPRQLPARQTAVALAPSRLRL